MNARVLTGPGDAGPGEGFLVLRPGAANKHYWGDLWRYRELFWILAWRDLAVRYKQTAIGVLWSVARPLLAMLVFTAIFGGLARLPTGGAVSYPVLVFTGMLPWTLFSGGLTDVSGSLMNNEHLISKIYFPRLIVPASAMVTALVDFAINTVMLALLMAWFGQRPGWQVVFAPAIVALTVATTLGPGLWLTALNVKYRDFRFVIPFVVQFGLYVSPVGFSSLAVPERWQLLYRLNPLVGVIDAFRWSLLGAPWPGGALAMSLVVSALLWWGGLRAFRRMERSFADLI